MAYSCGYQLQDTSSLADRAGKVFIETNDSYSSFYKVLKNRMKINGISFSESRSSADTIIIINNDDFKERVITVSSSNYPKEYEINLEVTWSLLFTKIKLLLRMPDTQRWETIALTEIAYWEKSMNQTLLKSRYQSMLLRRLS